jgi:hypothetical protein
MKSRSRRSLTFAFLLLTSSWGVGFGQSTIDATVSVRQRQHNVDVYRGGGVGKKIPLMVAVVSTGDAPDVNGKSKIKFVITNLSKENIVIPISPHPRDVEPVDPKVDYTVRCLSLKIHPAKEANDLPGGAVLYGSADVSGTLRTLSPGETIQILTLVALPSPSLMDSGFVASAGLRNETIKTVDHQKVSDLQEIGSAYSRPFKLQTILRTASVNPSHQ